MTLPAGVTPRLISSQLTAGLLADQNAIATLEQEVSSGRAIVSPAQDPAGAAQALSLSSSLTRTQQYVRNAQDGQGWLSTAGSALSQAIGVLQQVRSLALSAGNPTGTTSAELAAMADQVDAARLEVVNLANTSYQGQPVFGGTAGVPAAYASDGTYLGNAGLVNRTVAPGVTMPVATTGPAVFTSGGADLLLDKPATSTTPAQLGVLAQLSADLRSGTPAAIGRVLGSDLSQLDSVMATMENQAAQLGAGYQQMVAMQQQAQQASTTLQSQLSSVQDVNLAEVVTNLKTEETSYQAALWATAQVARTSLVQFLG